MQGRNLHYYVEKYKINELFETDMTPYMSLQHYHKGDEIISVGEIMENFYFIVEGKVKIFLRMENGKSLLLRFSRPLSELGSAELQRFPRTVTGNVQAQFDTTVIRIPFSAIDKHAVNDARFLRYVVKSLGFKLATASNAHSITASYPFKNRFASYLISITSLDDRERIDEIKIDKFTELAEFLGTSYRHLCRVVAELEDEGIVRKSGKRFMILDHGRLEGLSGGFYE